MHAILALLFLTDPTFSEVPQLPPPTTVGMEARLALLRGDATRIASTAGFGFEIFGRERWLMLGPVELAAGLDLSFDQFNDSIKVTGTNAAGVAVSWDDSQRLTHTSFLAMQTARGARGRFSAQIAGGGGVSISHFYRPAALMPSVDKSGWLPVVRGSAQLGFQAWRDTALTLQFTYTFLFSDDVVTVGEGTIKPFGDVMDVGLGAMYRF